MRNIELITDVLREMFLSHFRPKIRHLILHVTNRCNMRCRHCFVDFKNAGNELDLDEIKRISGELKGLIWLDIGGGEPFLRNDLAKIISFFDFKELSVPTNGWETDSIHEKVKEIHSAVPGKLIITLSLEGTKKTHDEIRCSGSFDRTLKTFEKLKKINGIRVKFNTVLCEKNAAEIPELMRFVRTLNPDFHSLLMLRGAPNDPSMRLPSPDKISEIEKETCLIQDSYAYGRKGILSRVQKNYQTYKAALIRRILARKRQVIPCLAGSSHVVVWPEGNVAPCELLPPEGNIRTESFRDILKGERMKGAIAAIKRGACFCTHDCNMVENILFNPKAYRKLIK